MPDIYTPDPNRIIRRTSVGDIQAWGAPLADVSVSLGIYAGVQHADTQVAYFSQNLNMTSADARRLGKSLIEAADHADKVRTDHVEEAA